MKALGEIPVELKVENILSAIGENLILADVNYNIVWLNPAAVQLLSQLIKPYGIKNIEDLIGMNMDAFHEKPVRQRAIMDRLEKSHRTRINIRDRVVTDIVIDPIWKTEKEIAGYVVMLMDVTVKAQEEEKREQLIEELSVPVMQIWDHALALPLRGSLDEERFDLILSKLLNECKEQHAYYVVVDLSGVKKGHDQITYQLDRMISALELMGTSCLIAGVQPILAEQLFHFTRKVPFFPNVKAATKYIISAIK